MDVCFFCIALNEDSCVAVIGSEILKRFKKKMNEQRVGREYYVYRVNLQMQSYDGRFAVLRMSLLGGPNPPPPKKKI